MGRYRDDDWDADWDAEDQPKEEKRKKRKRKKRRNPLKLFFWRLVLTVSLLLALLFFGVHKAYQKMTYHRIDSVAGEAMRRQGVTNILLIGNDSRENGEDGRSDAIILLSVSEKNHKICMTSLLRDIYVEIPGHDNNRLNAAYSFGGAELLMQTVEKNFGIEVDRYVLVNFEAFANLVDAVGGVELELSGEEVSWVNAYLNEYNLLTDREFGTDYMEAKEGGVLRLNGPQALAYSRNRYIGTDFGRTERQRKVLAEVMKQLPKSMLHPSAVYEGLFPNLTTNLTEWECFQMTLAAPFLIRYDVEQSHLPVQGSYRDATIRGMAVLEVDFAENREALREMLTDRAEEE